MNIFMIDDLQLMIWHRRQGGCSGFRQKAAFLSFLEFEALFRDAATTNRLFYGR